MITPIYENGAPVPHLFQIGGQEQPKQLSEDQEWKQASGLVATPPTPQAKPRPVAAPSVEPRKATTLVAELKARLRLVEREIRARKVLEDERDSLKRLIAAAKAEPNNVRRIRAAG